MKTTRFQREVCCATYSPVLGILACVSKDSVIRIFDPDRWGPEAQLAQLQVGEEDEEDEEERDTEILCMTFLEPYPTLVCGDSSGYLSFFSVRPSLYKNQLLLRVNVLSAITSTAVSFTKCKSVSNFLLNTPLASGGVGNSSKVGAIFSLAFSAQTKTIFTGTESGDILGWSLEMFFTKSAMKAHDPKKKVYSVTHSETAYTVPALEPEDVEITQWWKGHSDAVTCLSVLGEGNGLLSGSRDKRVRAWDSEGNYHGTLRQVLTDDAWSLPIDTKSIHTNLIKTASDILTTIKLSPLTIPTIESTLSSSPSIDTSSPFPFDRKTYEPPRLPASPTTRRPTSPSHGSSSPTSRRSPPSSPMPNFPFFTPTSTPKSPPFNFPTPLPPMPTENVQFPASLEPITRTVSFTHTLVPPSPMASVRPHTPTHPSLSNVDHVISPPFTRPNTPSTNLPKTPHSPASSRPKSPVTSSRPQSPATSSRPKSPMPSSRPKSALRTPHSLASRSRSPSPLTLPSTPHHRSIPASPIPTSPKLAPITKVPSLSHLNNRQQQAALRLSMALENIDDR
eukprot:Phypoly_transcript_04981.p1 GENE.Phypoly_transcript_04981~~Phypoly_transcript_04981.p1  ORF type:complete len:607 (+),score=104.63 Phypoly_transcript_04981:134-1822(+)